MIRVLVPWKVINLLGLNSHESVSRWYITQVKLGHTTQSKDVLLLILQKMSKPYNELFIVYNLHILIRIELVFEFTIVSGVSLINEPSKVISRPWFLHSELAHFNVHSFLLNPLLP